MNTIGAVLLATLAGSAPAPAARPSTDVYFEQTTVAYAGGRPSGPGVVSRVWYGGQRLRMEAGGVAPAPALILRLDQGKAYRVDPAQRRVIVLDAERLRTRGQMDSAMAGELMGADERAGGHHRSCPASGRWRVTSAAASASAAAPW